jgi:formylglycine-generating enzyme required for sulfatase activity
VAAALGAVAAISALILYSQHVLIQREVDRWLEFRIAATPSERLRTTELGATFLDCVDHGDAARCPRMVVIPAGEFIMGSAETDPYHRLDQGPQRRIVVHRFALSRTEISIGQWTACVDAGGCSRELGEQSWADDMYPATGLSWLDAQEYVAWLARMTGKSYRLPTEAEWEFAARAATGADARQTRYSWGDEEPTCENAQFGDCVVYYSPEAVGHPEVGAQTPRPVGSFAPNGFGLYNMHGNAFEWVQDCYTVYDPARADAAAIETPNTQAPGYADFARWSAENTHHAPIQGDPPEADLCSLRVLRGGSFITPAWALTSAYRVGYEYRVSVDSFGFRVARSLGD